jgi:hypothetical protein
MKPPLRNLAAADSAAAGYLGGILPKPRAETIGQTGEDG